ncbi:outer membrane protein assembly factor BamD [Sphingobacterium corticis]|uniref:Outer membrane protein assembly factor BamD n=1 Tax=Sphingobacterium corticis TaxID=1812823 RepID=A0ABW5NKI9_9SPHI
MFSHKRIWVFACGLAAVLSLGACKSRFEKLRASNNIQNKYLEAVKYYEAGKYTKASILFTDLLTRYRASAEAEDLNYYTAYTSYRMKDYISARFHFKNFAQNYPNSARAEECRFMSAYCFYLDSPRTNLDQENTYKAIDEMQLFVNLYPQSERTEEANDLIQKLRDKLEKKSFDNAKLYYNMGQPADYRAAVIAFESMLREFPDTKYAEEAEYLIVRSQYMFAENSAFFRQEERYNDAIDFYQSFVQNYPESKYVKELDVLRRSAERKILLAVKQTDQMNEARKQHEEELGISGAAGAANGTATNGEQTQQ